MNQWLPPNTPSLHCKSHLFLVDVCVCVCVCMCGVCVRMRTFSPGRQLIVKDNFLTNNYSTTIVYKYKGMAEGGR
jgi:hypothetical protein